MKLEEDRLHLFQPVWLMRWTQSMRAGEAGRRSVITRLRRRRCGRTRTLKRNGRGREEVELIPGGAGRRGKRRWRGRRRRRRRGRRRGGERGRERQGEQAEEEGLREWRRDEGEQAEEGGRRRGREGEEGGKRGSGREGRLEGGGGGGAGEGGGGWREEEEQEREEKGGGGRGSGTLGGATPPLPSTPPLLPPSPASIPGHAQGRGPRGMLLRARVSAFLAGAGLAGAAALLQLRADVWDSHRLLAAQARPPPPGPSRPLPAPPLPSPPPAALPAVSEPVPRACSRPRGPPRGAGPCVAAA